MNRFVKWIVLWNESFCEMIDFVKWIILWNESFCEMIDFVKWITCEMIFCHTKNESFCEMNRFVKNRFVIDFVQWII